MPGYSLVPELQAELPATPSGANEMQMERRREGIGNEGPAARTQRWLSVLTPSPR